VSSPSSKSSVRAKADRTLSGILPNKIVYACLRVRVRVPESECVRVRVRECVRVRVLRIVTLACVVSPLEPQHIVQS
jgi:hypothetical protein